MTFYLITNLKFKSVRNRSNDHEKSIDQASCHWNISKDQNWSSYQRALDEAFSDWDPNGFQDIDFKFQVLFGIHFYNSGTHLPDGASNIETKYIQINKEKIQYCELGARFPHPVCVR